MNKAILLLSLLLLSQNAFSFDLSQSDKQKHIAVSTAISSTITGYTRSALQGWAGCMAIGTAKEVYDHSQEGNKFDNEDMIANAIGCGIGIPIGRALHMSFNGEKLQFKWKF